MQAPEELLSEMTPIQFSFAQSNCPHFTPTSKPSPVKSAYRNVGIAKFPFDEKTGSQELPAATRRSRGGLLLRPRGTPVIELRVNHLAGGLDPKNRQCGVCEESNLL